MLDYEGKISKIKDIYDQLNDEAEDIEGEELSDRVIVPSNLLGKIEDILYLEDADLKEVRSERYKIGEDLSLPVFLGAFVEEMVEMQGNYDVEIDMFKKFGEDNYRAEESKIILNLERKGKNDES
jgi:hypothetical protein